MLLYPSFFFPSFVLLSDYQIVIITQVIQLNIPFFMAVVAGFIQNDYFHGQNCYWSALSIHTTEWGWCEWRRDKIANSQFYNILMPVWLHLRSSHPPWWSKESLKTRDILIRCKDKLTTLHLFDALYASLFLYEWCPDLIRAVCEYWCPKTNTFYTFKGEVFISIFDIHSFLGCRY